MCGRLGGTLVHPGSCIFFFAIRAEGCKMWGREEATSGPSRPRRPVERSIDAAVPRRECSTTHTFPDRPGSDGVRHVRKK